MNLIEFFNSDELELPRSWETFAGSFDEYLDQAFANYLALYQQITPQCYLSDRIVHEFGLARSISNALCKCIKAYLLGHPPHAYQPLAEALRIAHGPRNQ